MKKLGQKWHWDKENKMGKVTLFTVLYISVLRLYLWICQEDLINLDWFRYFSGTQKAEYSTVYQTLPPEEDDIEVRVSEWQHREFKLCLSFCHGFPGSSLNVSSTLSAWEPHMKRDSKVLPSFQCWLLNQNRRFSEAEVVSCYKIHSTLCTTEVWSQPRCNK